MTEDYEEWHIVGYSRLNYRMGYKGEISLWDAILLHNVIRIGFAYIHPECPNGQEATEKQAICSRAYNHEESPGFKIPASITGFHLTKNGIQALPLKDSHKWYELHIDV